MPCLTPQAGWLRGHVVFCSIACLGTSAIRDTRKATVEEFKEKLDKFLAVLPYEPKIGEMIPHICDQTFAKIKLKLLQQRKLVMITPGISKIVKKILWRVRTRY